jgi:hypothetical protein
MLIYVHLPWNAENFQGSVKVVGLRGKRVEFGGGVGGFDDTGSMKTVSSYSLRKVTVCSGLTFVEVPRKSEMIHIYMWKWQHMVHIASEFAISAMQ